MTAAIALTQYDISKDAYKLRIGNDLIELPSELTDKIGVAIGKVSTFNTVHAMVAHEMWDGDFDCDPDTFEMSNE